MRILSFSYCFPNHRNPTWGIHVFQRMAAQSRLAGVELQAVAPVPTFPLLTRLRGCPGPVTETWEGLTVHRPRFLYIPKIWKSLDGRLYGRGLRHWLAGVCSRWRPDVLDAQFEWPDGVGISHLAKSVDVPCTITLSGYLYECMEYPRMLRQCVEALRAATTVVSVSTHMAETAVELGVSRDKIHVIPNGVDTQRFMPRDKVEARRELGLPTDGRLIVTVAHLGPRKGHRETIRAIADLPGDVRLVLVGSDSQGGGKNERALRQLIDRFKLGGRVILAGQQPYWRIPLYFNAADLSVLASYREGCPNVVLESLASGTPAVASDVGHVSAMIEDTRNGKLVPPRQVGPLAEAITELLDRPPSPHEVRRSAAVRSWDDVAAEICDTLRDALGYRPSRDGCGERAADAAHGPQGAAAGQRCPEEV